MKFTIDLYKQEFSLLHTVLYCVTTESDYWFIVAAKVKYKPSAIWRFIIGMQLNVESLTFGFDVTIVSKFLQIKELFYNFNK